MFSRCVDSNQVTQLSETFFRCVDGSEIEGDYGLLTAERLLLKPRMPEGERHSILYEYYDKDGDAKSIIDQAIKDYASKVSELTNDFKSSIMIAGIGVRRKELFEAFKDMSFDEMNDTPEALNLFLNVKAGACAFIQKDKHRTLILMSNPGPEKLHALCAVIPLLHPWYFPEQVDNEEFEYLESFLQDSDTDMKHMFRVLCDRMNLQEYVMQETILKLQKVMRESRLNNIDSSISLKRNVIEDLIRQTREVQFELNKLIDERFGIENKDDDSAYKDMLAYLSRTKNIVLKNVIQETKLLFYFKGDLVNYPDVIKTLIHNPRAFVNQMSSEISIEDRHKILMAIFDTQDIAVQIAGYLTIDVQRGNYVKAYSTGDFDEMLSDNCIPNPHWCYYNCLGGNSSAISSYAIKGDMTGLLAQAQAAVCALNLREQPTTDHFMSDLFAMEYRCLRLPDGTIANAKEAAEYLRKQEEKQHE